MPVPATDNIDGSVSVTTSGSVDTDTPGKYTQPTQRQMPLETLLPLKKCGCGVIRLPHITIPHSNQISMKDIDTSNTGWIIRVTRSPSKIEKYN